MPTLAGDVEGAVAFGLAANEAALTTLTALICSGIPPDAECIARWHLEGTRTCAMSVEDAEFKYYQAFERTDEGLAVNQGFFWLEERSRRRGFAKGLMRNLVHAYDNLGIRQVDVYAGLEDGGIAWAKLGARPKDPDAEREWLLDQIPALSRQLGLDEEIQEAIEEVLAEAPEEELMQRAVALQLDDGTKLGELLLKRHEWAGYWNLGDAAQRRYLIGVLKK